MGACYSSSIHASIHATPQLMLPLLTRRLLLVAELAKARQEAAAAASSSSKAMEATSDDMPVLPASKTAADDSTFGNLAAQSLSQSNPDVEAAAANIM